MSEWAVTLVNTFDQFQSLREDWDRLLIEARPDNMFLSFDWICRWWEFYGKDYELWTPVAEREGRVEGIQPMMLARRRDGTRRLLLLGAGDILPNRVDVIAAPAMRGEVTRAFWRFMAERSDAWDLLEFEDLPEDSPWVDLLTRELDGQAPAARVSVSSVNYTIALPASFQDYLQSRGAKTRADLRSHQRRLLKSFPTARYERVRTEPDLERVFDALVNLHQARWNQRGVEGAFADNRFADFHRESARAGLENGTLRLYYLEVENKTIGVCYWYRIGRRVSGYQTAFDIDWRDHGVGNLVLTYALEQSIAEGAEEFDFLQGDEAYKEHWATGVRDNIRLQAASPKWRGQLAWARVRSEDELRQLAHRWVPRRARRTAKRVLQRARHLV